ncbi:YopX family protein [Lapidilactobacillus mulanensis]|uniref:YopX family protein n=1 Tax=Lapidilactobacillus mulanensis TaxID=2485999 RepID=A0ABW4DPE2_9LACO|nr:YopX family protein [Lapidilactobacillus mulanensis]
MRTIKFRAWNGRAKQMAKYVTAIQMGDTQGTPSSVNVIVNRHSETWEVEHDKVELLQYTGLEDTYEGDILQDDDDVGSVYYEQGQFYVLSDGDEYPLDEWQYATVIGNIYENPEMLEEDK